MKNLKHSILILFFATTMMHLSMQSKQQVSFVKSFVTSFNQTDSNTYLIWNKNRPLVWDDFKGKINSNSTHTAASKTKIDLITPDVWEDSLTIIIPAYFYTMKSWSKNKSSIILLKHEQGHFDIAEIIARNIRKKYSVYRINDLHTAKIDLQKYYDYYCQQFGDSLDLKYDSETKHGTNLKAQARWNKKNARELKNLEEFANPRVVLYRH